MRISDWSSDVCSSDLRARLGSHDGAATSRNASTLPGLIMAETMRPKPKMSPEASAMSSFLTVSKLHDVPSDVHSRSRCAEEEAGRGKRAGRKRSEEHTSELHSLMRISYAVFCLNKKNNTYTK